MSIVGVQFVYVNPSLRAIQEVYNETYTVGFKYILILLLQDYVI